MKINLISALLVASVLSLGSCNCDNGSCKSSPCDSCQDCQAVNEEGSIVRLNVFYRVSEEANREQAIAAARKLVEASRGDEGCISYDFLESSTVPGEYMIVETWTNDSLLQLHSNAPHFKEYVPVLAELGEMRTDRFLMKE